MAGPLSVSRLAISGKRSLVKPWRNWAIQTDPNSLCGRI